MVREIGSNTPNMSPTESSVANRAFKPSTFTVLTHRAGEALKGLIPDFSGKNLTRIGTAVAVGGVVAPIVEPVASSYIDSRGAVNAEGEKPVRAELPKLPYWATSAPEDKPNWDKLRPNVREFMQIALGTGDRELVDAVNYMLDRSTETLTGGEAVGNYRIVTVFRLNPNPTGKAPFSASWGPDGKTANQLDFSLQVDKNFTRDPQYQIDSLDTATSFMFAVNSIRLAEALAKTQDNVSEANSLLDKNQPNIGKEAARLASVFAKRVIDQRLYDEWGLKGPAQAVLLEPEEASAPPEVPADAAADKPAEPSDNASAGDPGITKDIIP